MPSQNGIDTIAVRRQSEMQELLGHPPGWILHSGITVIFLALGAALWLSWLIRYPDKLVAEAVIQSENLPAELRIRETGRLDTVLQPDKAKLSSGDIVAVMESAADWQDMLLLDSLLSEMEGIRNVNELAGKEMLRGLALGPVQTAFAELEQALAGLHFFLDQTAFSDRIAALEREAAAVKLLRQAYHEQQAFFQMEKQLVAKTHKRNAWLYGEGVASEVELEQSESLVLQYEQKMKNLEVSSIQNTIRLRQLESQAAEARHEFENRRHILWQAFRQALQNLQSVAGAWKKQHLLHAPVGGMLELAPEAQSHAAVQAGQLLGAVLPHGKAGSAVAFLQLPALGIGKVEIGAPVKISLAAYPPMEYGLLQATVEDITLNPQGEKGEALYYIRALILDSLRTNYGFTIPLRPNMPATAEVITKDRRILERMVDKFVDAVRN